MLQSAQRLRGAGVAAVAGMLCMLSGCGGGEYEHVSYGPAWVEDPPHKVEIPDAQAGAPPGDAPSFTVPGTVKSNEVVQLSGRFRPKEAAKINAVMVEFNARIAFRPGDFPAKVTCGSAQEMPEKDRDGYWRYTVQIPAPIDPREYEIEVLHFGDLVAIGKATVE
jgi:hypothetical protein